MNAVFGNMRTTIQLTVVLAFVIATTLTASLAIGLQYYFGQSMATTVATNLYATASSGIAAELRSAGRINANVIDLLAQNPVLASPQGGEAHLDIFTQVLLKNPLYYGIYLGGNDGSFFEVINLNTSESARNKLHAHPHDRWLIISMQAGANDTVRRYRYLDENLQLRLSRSEPTDFDLRTRPWFVSAMASNAVQMTEPYIFAQLGVPGRTLSKRLANSNSVVAIDMTLATLSDFLTEQKISAQSDVYLFDKTGEVIASSKRERKRQSRVPVLDLERTKDQGAYVEPTPNGSSELDWLPFEASDRTPQPDVVPSQKLTQIAADPALQGQLLETSLAGDAYLAYGAPTADGENPLYIGILTPRDDLVAPFLDQVKLSILFTTAFLLLMLPLSWVFAKPIVRPIRELAQENEKVKRREFAKVKHVRSNVQELDDLSDSMVSMVAAIQTHELEQRALMDAFIELIAQAIDDKSAYTGSHCKRVPELALMLAEHAVASELPAFRDFTLTSDDEWREYRIAAWLHDCGKITTPEHIVDKGSKLEAIYNRLHEVRMRFEVLWRDAEIEYLKQRHTSPQLTQALESQWQQRQRELLEQFAFVASCNVGGEFLGQDELDRLQAIAQQTWQRHFDDRIGLSPLEELRAQGQASPLPQTEYLLSDKPEHIINREHEAVYPAEYGIDMDVPAHLYNQGEIYNLSVSRGTLTREDRFKINEHMISTIKMLESLPFPEELKNVPRYASTHHETLRGTGYPRKLPGAALSIPERILAIADIFEALTASDRPYKRAKTVSEAIEILHKMVLDDHIDKDCFELFLRDKVYLQYAREFLPESQIDEVDTQRYLST